VPVVHCIGEADPEMVLWCARYCAENVELGEKLGFPPCMILSGDSDFYVCPNSVFVPILSLTVSPTELSFSWISSQILAGHLNLTARQ